jgi:hypothetical protein
VLRGGDSGPDYSADHVAEAERCLEEAGLDRAVMVDCSHGSSQKNTTASRKRCWMSSASGPAVPAQSSVPCSKAIWLPAFSRSQIPAAAWFTANRSRTRASIEQIVLQLAQTLGQCT